MRARFLSRWTFLQFPRWRIALIMLRPLLHRQGPAILSPPIMSSPRYCRTTIRRVFTLEEIGATCEAIDTCSVLGHCERWLVRRGETESTSGWKHYFILIPALRWMQVPGQESDALSASVCGKTPCRINVFRTVQTFFLVRFTSSLHQSTVGRRIGCKFRASVAPSHQCK